MKNNTHARPGFTLTEVLASIAITTMLVGGMAAFTVKVTSEMTAAKTRNAVAHWAAGQLEQARTINSPKQLADFAAKSSLPEYLQLKMVRPKIQATVNPVPGYPNLRRLDLNIQWTTTAGAPASPVHLATLVPVVEDKP